jgi:hypothetical protein
MRNLLTLTALANTVLSLMLFMSAGQRFPQTNYETEEMTAATGGRQVSILAPAPTAPLQLAAGVISGAIALVSAAGALGAGVKAAQDAPELEDSTALESPSFYVPIPSGPPALGREPSHRITAPVAQSTKITAPMVQSPKVSTKAAKWSSPLLDAEKNPELAMLANAGMITVVGGQGAGKTTFVAGLIAARQLMGHHIVIFNHHKAAGEYDPFHVYGAQGNDFSNEFVDIQGGLAALHKEINDRYIARKDKNNQGPPWAFENYPITVVLEEFSGYSDHIDKELLQSLFGSLTQEIRKARIYVVLVVHGLSKREAGGGVSGVITGIKNSSPKILLGRTPGGVDGFKPSGYCTVEIPGETPYKNIKVPDLAELVPNPKRPMDFTSIGGDNPLPLPWGIWKEKPAPPETSLSDKESAVVDFARGREYVTAKEVLAQEIVETEEEARGIFEALGKLGLARLNLENNVLHLLTERT